MNLLIRNYNYLIISGQITDFQFSEVLDSFGGADELTWAQCSKLVSLELHVLDELLVIHDPL